MISKSDEEVRQQCDKTPVDDAMSYAEDVAALSRDQVADQEDAYVLALAAEVRRLREASRVTAVNFGKAQLEIAKLQTKLARVERIFGAARIDPISMESPQCAQVLEDLLLALHDDPQPSAARGPWGCMACGHDHQGDRLANICIGCPCPETAPQQVAAPPVSKGEPYNGY